MDGIFPFNMYILCLEFCFKTIHSVEEGRQWKSLWVGLVIKLLLGMGKETWEHSTPSKMLRGYPLITLASEGGGGVKQMLTFAYKEGRSGQ